MPRNVSFEDRRVLSSDKRTTRLAACRRRQHGNIRAGDEGAETGQVAREQARFDHPEQRLVRQKGLGLIGRPDRHNNMRVVGR